ncbi:MerR family transcriptional regulator [Paenibacillus tritici]|nr:MerR family transcriptional regulator [Paenibacillus tritici]
MLQHVISPFEVTRFFDIVGASGYPIVIMNYKPWFTANLIITVFRREWVMKASEVSRLMGLPVSTLRFYERKQLIPEQYISRDDNNYRVYHEDVIAFLEDIKTLLSVNFTIQEIILLINENENSYVEKNALVKGKIQYIQELEEKLKASKTFLADVLEGNARFQTPCKSVDTIK